MGLGYGYFDDVISSEAKKELSEKLLRYINQLSERNESVRLSRSILHIISGMGLRSTLPVVEYINARSLGAEAQSIIEAAPKWVASSDSFYCCAVRARFGDDKAMRTLIDFYEKLDSDLTKIDVAYPILFSRRAEAVELIRPLVYLDVVIHGPTGRTENDKYAVPVAERAAGYLAELLTGFPEKPDVNACRRWLDKHPPGTKWDFKD